MFHNHTLLDAVRVPRVVVVGASTWDPANKTSHVSLDATKLIATGTGTTVSGDMVRSVISHTSGLYYSEHTLSNHVSGGSNTGIGLVDSAFTIGSSYLGGDTPAHSVCCYSDGHIYYNVGEVSAVAPITTGTVMQVAIEVGSKLLWYSRNGSGAWIGNAGNPGDPATNANGIPIPGFTGPIYFALDFEASEAGTIWTSKFSPSFLYTPPAGATGW